MNRDAIGDASKKEIHDVDDGQLDPSQLLLKFYQCPHYTTKRRNDDNNEEVLVPS